MKEIKELDNDKEENGEKRENYFIEVDGVILEKENKNIFLDNSFFMPEPIMKFIYFNNSNGKLENYNASPKINIKENKDGNYEINLNKNCLCVIEIKNQFPFYNDDKKGKEKIQIPEELKKNILLILKL